MNEKPSIDFHELLPFCRDHLGPASEFVLSRNEMRLALEARIAAGAAPRDAILAELFEIAKSDGEVAGEFLRYFTNAVSQLGRTRIPPTLRRQLDTADLMDSVLGDLWKDLKKLRFDNRAAFMALVSTALTNKMRSKLRRTQAQKRREDLRVYPADEHWDPSGDVGSPESEAARIEEDSRTSKLIRLLTEDEQRLLGALVQRKPIQEIAAELGMEAGEAKRIARGAIERLNRLRKSSGD